MTWLDGRRIRFTLATCLRVLGPIDDPARC